MAACENNDREYDGPERRTSPRCQCVQMSEAQIALMIEEEVERRLSKAEDKLLSHLDVKFGQLHKLIADAFPNGDPHGHRAYHELQIRQADGWHRIKGEVISKVATGGVWIGLGWLCFAIWQAFKESVKS